MTNSNPKSLLKLYKYSKLRLSSTERDIMFPQSHTAKPPEELPFEVELPENSPRRQNIPEETPFKKNPGEKVPLEKDSPEEEKNSHDHSPPVLPQI